jgi:hypothetical protein
LFAYAIVLGVFAANNRTLTEHFGYLFELKQWLES